MFTSDIIRKIKYYVYLLSDPISGEIFYVGKGKGNRVFSHLKDSSDNQKSRKIQELKLKGLEPKIEFLVHGVEGIAVCHLTSSDVVRHALVQKIVEAYSRI